MSLIALGLNHHTAPVDIRERAAIGEERLGEALRALTGVEAVAEAAIVSTCNRTEIYCGTNGADSRADAAVIEWMHAHLALGGQRVDDYLFQHSDRNAVHHLMRVASGLDSMVLGEPQILGQIKRAYRDAVDHGTLGSELSPLFQSVFSVAKQVRTDTAIGASPVSVAFAAVSLSRQIFDDLGRRTALLIGAGETIQLAARHLVGAGIGTLLIANRTPERAVLLAAETGGEALPLGDIASALPRADIVISSTGAPLPILGKGAVERALKARRYRSQLIVDIAVPRDVEAEAGELDGIFLYTVDDLQDVIDENRESRRAAADEAEEIVSNEVELYMRRRRALGARDTIRGYRARVDTLRAELLARGQRELAAGKEPAAVLERLAHGLANRVMHGPTARLREAAERGDTVLVAAARTLLDPPPGEDAAGSRAGGTGTATALREDPRTAATVDAVPPPAAADGSAGRGVGAARSAAANGGGATPAAEATSGRGPRPLVVPGER